MLIKVTASTPVLGTLVGAVAVAAGSVCAGRAASAVDHLRYVPTPPCLAALRIDLATAAREG
jgi:hypothetical protein